MTRPSLIIAGGGLAGSLVALALATRRPEIEFRLVEPGERLGGNHIWSFFDGDLREPGRALVAPLITKSWPAHEVIFPKRRRVLGFGYNSVKSSQLDEVVRGAVPAGWIRRASVTALGADFVVLDNGERIEADGVIDARGPGDFSGIELAWQKFVGRTYRPTAAHGREIPIIMDATVAQADGYRFVYTLPFAADDLLIEDTYYSDAPDLDLLLLRSRIDEYARGAGEVTGEETGVLPVALGGSIETLWSGGAARLGLRGGFFHPTTGYSLPDAVANALLVVERRDFSGAALFNLFRERARALWKERGFFRLLNRMMFRAAAPEQRYRVLEHFYRLPEPVIARFYAARLTRLDKLRILSGRPPVPVFKALAAMRSVA